MNAFHHTDVDTRKPHRRTRAQPGDIDEGHMQGKGRFKDLFLASEKKDPRNNHRQPAGHKNSQPQQLILFHGQQTIHFI